MRQNKKIMYAAFAVLWVLIWQVAAAAIASPLLVPTPLEVVGRLFELAQTAEFWGSVGASLAKVLLGFLLAFFAGTFFAAISARFETAKAFFAPPMRVIAATPVASFIILAILWINLQALAFFIAFLMVLPIVYNNLLDAFVSTDKKLLEMARVFKFSKATALRTIFLPAAAPAIFAVVKSGVGLAWKAGIATEVLAMPINSIGTSLHYAKIYLETPDLFAWTLMVILLSVLIEIIFSKIAKTALIGKKLSSKSEVQQ